MVTTCETWKGNHVRHKTHCQNRRTGSPDLDPDVSYLEQNGFEGRLAEHQRGNFDFIGIRACADVVVNGVCQSIYSGGLWGVESDSDESYLQSIESEEIDSLKSILYDLGFTEQAVSAACALQVRKN